MPRTRDCSSGMGHFTCSSIDINMHFLASGVWQRAPQARTLRSQFGHFYCSMCLTSHTHSRLPERKCCIPYCGTIWGEQGRRKEVLYTLLWHDLGRARATHARRWGFEAMRTTGGTRFHFTEPFHRHGAARLHYDDRTFR